MSANLVGADTQPEWELTSQSWQMERPLNIKQDTYFPGTHFCHQHAHGQSLKLHKYHNVDVLWYNYGVYVLALDGKPIKELCYLYGDAPPVESLCTENPRQLPGVTASIAHWVPGNYCHILAEHLPLLQALDEAGELDHADHLICDGWAANLLSDALQLYRARPNVVTIKTIDHVRCDTLLAFEPIMHPAHWGHEVMSRFFDKVRRHADPASPHRRLIVTRPAGRRGFANQAELAAALPGFEIVDIDKPMSLFEQARLFAEAELVVCGHGAALTNLVFMQPGTGVVEIFNHDYGMASFWILAGARGIDYCASVDVRGASASGAGDKNQDIMVDVPAVLECVRLLDDARSAKMMR